ncbi:hypothetical protein JW823_09840 [bacterium]|nr:hypothetical protein [candidate division CSSED10-310 bacterium]
MTNVQEKKGLSPLAWVGIGCGAILLIALVVVFAGGVFVAHKMKDVAGDFKENPEMAAARLIVRMNPEIEEVDHDEDAGTITIREKKTGKTVTANFEDIKEGKMTLRGENGETITFDADKNGEGGSMKVTSEEGSWEMASGTQAEDVPDWIPLPDGVAPGGHTSMKSDDGIAGGLMIKSNDSIETVMNFYQSELDGNGFQTTTHKITGDSGDSAVVSGISESTGRSVTVSISKEEETTICSITYSEKMK